MAKKYDTNPLDPEFPQRAKEMQTETLPNLNAETQEIPYAPPTEQETRRFGDSDFSAYSSPFNGQNIPANFHTAKLDTDVGNSSKRKVANVGLPENIMVALPYIPFYIGLIASIIELLIVPRSETKVRFYAAQGLAAYVAILIVSAILNGVGHVSGFANAGSIIFALVTTVMLIVFAVKAWRGKPVHIESVDDLTNWLDEKIKPRG
ncbi:MAG: hypothetical protein M3033_15950 [Acidobacteriota bacterium]|nr:hypothetical protein [Acidobacteriota bacterium]